MSEPIEQLREEARKLAADPGNVAMRSCWNCNPAHERLKSSEYLIWCFGCGHYYFRGVDITEDDDDGED